MPIITYRENLADLKLREFHQSPANCFGKLLLIPFNDFRPGLKLGVQKRLPFITNVNSIESLLREQLLSSGMQNSPSEISAIATTAFRYNDRFGKPNEYH